MEAGNFWLPITESILLTPGHPYTSKVFSVKQHDQVVSIFFIKGQLLPMTAGFNPYY